MNINKIYYKDYIKQIPDKGKHILAQQTEENILVYQAFRKSIADYAVKNQKFGGADYSYNRMSWIKPNFLWMMYRSGWAAKKGQERILGIWIKKRDFDEILKHSAFTSFAQANCSSHEDWKSSLESNPVRLQWDPDHDPFGEKQERKAIQLGIKGEMLHRFGKEMILEIMDVSDFVVKQREKLNNDFDELQVPSEAIYIPNEEEVIIKSGLTINNNK